MRCLFEDLQLALYARAWEVLHPNDRVVGVGASEVGESTTHYVELDSDLAHVSEGLLVGDVTDVFSQHFPATTQTGATTTPFRRWMAERLIVAQRAVSTAAQGHVHPTPGAHCSYCTVAHSCDVSDYTGVISMIRFNNSQRLGLDLDRHIALDAGAGTGKTTVMAERYVQHLFAADQRATHVTPLGPRTPLSGHGALRAQTRTHGPKRMAGAPPFRSGGHHVHSQVRC